MDGYQHHINGVKTSLERLLDYDGINRDFVTSMLGMADSLVCEQYAKPAQCRQRKARQGTVKESHGREIESDSTAGKTSEVDAVTFYFRLIDAPILTMEQERCAGRQLVSSRDAFTYAVARNYVAARQMANDIECRIKDKLDGVFGRKDGDISGKASVFSEVLKDIYSLCEKAEKYAGSDVSNYKVAQDSLEDAFRRSGVRIQHLAILASRHLDALDGFDELQKAKQDYLAYQGAKQSLFLSIARLAAGFARRGVGNADFVNDWIERIGIANMGALEAVERFDPERGFKLSTYATHWIKQSLGRYSSKGGLSHRPRVIALARRYFRMRNEFFLKNGREPAANELSDLLGVKEEDLAGIIGFSNQPMSLDCAFDEDSGNLRDIIGKEDEQLEEASARIDNKKFWGILKTLLDEREMYVVKNRFCHGRELEDLGNNMGVSRERVRQIEMQALSILRANRHLLKGFVDSPERMEAVSVLARQKLPAYSSIVKDVVREFTGLSGYSLNFQAARFAEECVHDRSVSKRLIRKSGGNRLVVADEEGIKLRLKEIAKVKLLKNESV